MADNKDVVSVDRLIKIAHLAAVPDTMDGEGTANQFINRLSRQHGSVLVTYLIDLLASLGSFGSRSSRFWAPILTCLQRIIRKLIVTPIEWITS